MSIASFYLKVIIFAFLFCQSFGGKKRLYILKSLRVEPVAVNQESEEPTSSPPGSECQLIHSFMDECVDKHPKDTKEVSFGAFSQ